MKINFVFSPVYNSILGSDKFPEAKEYLQDIEKRWGHFGDALKNRITELLHLSWQETSVDCFLLKKGPSFSYPLTVNAFEKKGRFFIVLAHELIHVLMRQNEVDLSYLGERPRIERNHIPVFAALANIIPEFFGEEAWQQEQQRNKKHNHYAEALEYVLENGPQTVLQEFIKNNHQ